MNQYTLEKNLCLEDFSAIYLYTYVIINQFVFHREEWYLLYVLTNYVYLHGCISIKPSDVGIIKTLWLLIFFPRIIQLSSCFFFELGVGIVGF